MSQEVRGGEAPSRFQRAVACADTRTVHPEPHLLSARDDGNSGIRHSCAHMRGHARSLNPLARGCLTPHRRMGILLWDTAALGCARQMPDPLPEPFESVGDYART